MKTFQRTKQKQSCVGFGLQCWNAAFRSAWSLAAAVPVYYTENQVWKVIWKIEGIFSVCRREREEDRTGVIMWGKVKGKVENKVFLQELFLTGRLGFLRYTYSMQCIIHNSKQYIKKYLGERFTDLNKKNTT